MPRFHNRRVANPPPTQRVMAVLCCWLSAGCTVLTSCSTTEPESLCLAAPPDDAAPLIAAARIAVGTKDDRVFVRGFSGAVPSEATLNMQVGDATYALRADERGRFSWSPPQTATPQGAPQEDLPSVVRIQVEDQPAMAFHVRSSNAGVCAVESPIPTGTTPNDVAVHSCGNESFAFVVHSSDGTVAAFHPSGVPPPPAVSFEVDERQRGANPWSIAFDAEGGNAAVTLFGQHAVAWIEPCAGRLQHIARPALANGSPLWLDISPPVDLDLALDVDDDGQTETHIERMLPRTPQGIAFTEGRWLVTFTNLLQVGVNPVYGPGLLVAFEAQNGKWKATEHQRLPCTNPQSLSLDEAGNPWISCSGVLGPGPDGFTALSDGHLLRVSARTLEIEEDIPMGDFAPGTAGFYDRFIVVGSLVRPQVMVLERGAVSSAEGTLYPLDETDRVESVFEVIPYLGGLVLLTEYGRDRVHVLDLETGELNPWPFEAGLSVGPGGPAFHGVQSLAMDHVGASGADARQGFALLAQSHELVPLRLWQVMGP